MNSTLEQELGRAAALNGNPDWTGANKIALIQSVHCKNRHVGKVVDIWKRQAKQAGESLYIVPVNSWYREKDGIVAKSNYLNDAKAFAKMVGLPVYSGTVKVNYTNHTDREERQPSFYAGAIPANARLIIYDEECESGSTVRDFARYLESAGGRVAGVACLGDGYHLGDSYKPVLTGDWNKLFPDAVKELPHMPPMDSIFHPQELLSFIRQTQRAPERFICQPPRLACAA